MSQSADYGRRSYFLALVALLIGVFSLGLYLLRARPDSLSHKSTLERVIATKTIRAAYIVYPPTVIGGSSTGKPTGFLIDIINEIASRGKLQVTYEPTTFDDFQIGLDAGRYDIVVAGIFNTVSRAEKMTLTKPIMYWRGVAAITSTAMAGKYRLLDDLNDEKVRIAITNNTAEHEFVKRHLPKADIKPQTGSDIALTLAEVGAGRADVAFADIVTIRKFLASQKDTTVLFDGKPFNTFATSFAVRLGDYEWATFVNSSIDSLQVDGTINNLSRRYKGEDVWMLPKEGWE